MHHIEIEWTSGMSFQGRNSSGARITIGKPASGESGPSAMELVLFALAGCTGADVVSMLQKARVPIHQFKIQVDAERSPTYPKVYQSFHLTYQLWTDTMERATALQRAIQLSREKYCSVGIMLEKAAPVHHDVEVFVNE